jgi:hypothetical protein
MSNPELADCWLGRQALALLAYLAVVFGYSCRQTAGTKPVNHADCVLWILVRRVLLETANCKLGTILVVSGLRGARPRRKCRVTARASGASQETCQKSPYNGSPPPRPSQIPPPPPRSAVLHSGFGFQSSFVLRVWSDYRLRNSTARPAQPRPSTCVTVSGSFRKMKPSTAGSRMYMPDNGTTTDAGPRRSAR